MEQQEGFSYTYRAPANQEVLDIRRLYLPRVETGLEELKRLDQKVQHSGVIGGLCAGMLGCLFFALGLCLVLQVIGNAIWLGILLGLIGVAGILSAYPIHQKVYRSVKALHTPRILELVAELDG